MIDYYAARAPEYDRIYAKPERQADLRLVEAWLVAQTAGKQVLEVACGTGYWTQFIALQAARLVALDAAPQTLRIAATRVPNHQVTLISGDAYDLPRDQGTFDAAFAGFWFSHVPVERQREFLLGLHRVLAPGARVMLLDNRLVQGSSTPISECDAAGNTYQMRTLGDGSTHRVLKNFPQEPTLHSLIDGMGHQGVWQAWDYFWAYTYRTR
jgi:ubiquinone/menaquinone biosynthesis C-methylase UbiE